jgi:hypothetical protein
VIDRHRRDVVGRAGAAERDLAGNLRVERNAAGDDRARHDRVHPDAVRAKTAGAFLDDHHIAMGRKGARRRLAGRRIDVGDDHAGALAHDLACDPEPDAVSASGDERGVALEQSIHGKPPVTRTLYCASLLSNLPR